MSVELTAPTATREALLNSKVFRMQHHYAFGIVGDATGGWVVAKLYFNYPTLGPLPPDNYYLITHIYSNIGENNHQFAKLIDDQVAPISYLDGAKSNLHIDYNFSNVPHTGMILTLPADQYLNQGGAEFLTTPIEGLNTNIYLGKPLKTTSNISITHYPNTNTKVYMFGITLLSSREPIPPEIILQFK